MCERYFIFSVAKYHPHNFSSLEDRWLELNAQPHSDFFFWQQLLTRGRGRVQAGSSLKHYCTNIVSFCSTALLKEKQLILKINLESSFLCTPLCIFCAFVPSWYKCCLCKVWRTIITQRRAVNLRASCRGAMDRPSPWVQNRRAPSLI